MEHPEPTLAQLGKAPPVGPMARRCPYCPLRTQGGLDGLNAHIAVLHPGKKPVAR